MHAPGAAETTADSLSNALIRILWLESKRLAQILARHELTMPQYVTLHALQQPDQERRMGYLAQHLCQSSATTTGIVDRLEEAGLLTRAADPLDRRAVQVHLTTAGTRVLATVARAHRADLSAVLQHLQPSDQAALARLVDLYLGTHPGDDPSNAGGQ